MTDEEAKDAAAEEDEGRADTYVDHDLMELQDE